MYRGVPVDDKRCGKCNRLSNCGYHMPPREWAEQYAPKREWLSKEEYREQYKKQRRESEEAKYKFLQREAERKANSFDPIKEVQPPKVQAYLDRMGELCKLMQVHNNTLVDYLHLIESEEKVNAVLAKYHIGSTKQKEIIYWQIDLRGRVRTGKVMAYGNDGHRIKSKNANWMHAIEGIEQLAPQCLFGEHLLREHDGPIALVESEKTALIFSLLCPDTLWLATGGINGFVHDRLWPIMNYDVVVYPDADALYEWSKKAEIFNREGYNLIIPNEYRTMCTPEACQHKCDLADFLLQGKLDNEKLKSIEKHSLSFA